MAAPLIWPPVLVPSSETWNPNARASRSSGRTVDNAEQTVVGPTGYVTATLTVPCKEPAKVLAMRALLAGLDGRANAVLVGPIEVTRAPWWIDPLTGGRISTALGDRDALLDPAWGANADTSAALDFRLAADAVLNDTTLTVRRVRGGHILPGMLFSIADGLHVVTSLTTADPSGEAGEAAPGLVGIRFRPWLRDDHSAGTAIEFARPRQPMKLASDDTGQLELQLSQFGTVTLDLVEAS